MRGSRDKNALNDERGTKQMHIRTTLQIKNAIQRGALLSGVEHERTTLAADDHDAFFAALDKPPAPTGKLHAAFARHQETIALK